MTIEEWWKELDKAWTAIQAMMGVYLKPHEIEEAVKAKEERKSYPVYNALNELWWRLPDVPDTRSIPGFFQLCDLCSEYLGEEE